MKKIFFTTILILSSIHLMSQDFYSTGLSKGYKGGFDMEGSFFASEGEEESLIGFTTSHGYQFNPYIYVGAGVGSLFSTDWKKTAIPLFLEVKSNFSNKRVSPFYDIREGYNLGDYKGLFLEQSVGVNFCINKTFSSYCALGVRYAAIKHSIKDEHPTSLSFRFGLQF